MKVTIVYDNETLDNKLQADWGLSCFIEFNDKKILFDTGGNGRILLENLKQLEIEPESITDIVISHPDFDHIGGLSHLLNVNQTAVIHNPISFRGIKYNNKVKYYKKPTKIYENVFVTGEIDKREQSLGIMTPKGIVLIIGCCHPGLKKIKSAIEKFGEVYMIIGGLHGFDDYEVLDNINTVCATHCTKNKDKIKELYPEKYIIGGAGKVIEIE